MDVNKIIVESNAIKANAKSEIQPKNVAEMKKAISAIQSEIDTYESKRKRKEQSERDKARDWAKKQLESESEVTAYGEAIVAALNRYLQ